MGRRALVQLAGEPVDHLEETADGYTFAYLATWVARADARPVSLTLPVCAEPYRSLRLHHRGSAELCARIVRRFASEPGIALRDLYRQFLFAWWTGNGDLHLKNLSLWAGDSAKISLSPAYDLLNTRLFLPEDQLALSICGNKKEITPRMWRDFGQYCGLPHRAIASLAGALCSALPDACALVVSDTRGPCV